MTEFNLILVHIFVLRSPILNYQQQNATMDLDKYNKGGLMETTTTQTNRNDTPKLLVTKKVNLKDNSVLILKPRIVDQMIRSIVNQYLEEF